MQKWSVWFDAFFSVGFSFSFDNASWRFGLLLQRMMNTLSQKNVQEIDCWVVTELPVQWRWDEYSTPCEIKQLVALWLGASNRELLASPLHSTCLRCVIDIIIITEQQFENLSHDFFSNIGFPSSENLPLCALSWGASSPRREFFSTSQFCVDYLSLSLNWYAADSQTSLIQFCTVAEPLSGNSVLDWIPPRACRLALV